MAVEEENCPAPRESFIDQWWHDFRGGELRPLDEYLEMFPGDSESVSTRYSELCREQRVSAEAAPASADEVTETGGRIGPYRLLRELGRGGQGVVYLAEDERLQRRVALKVLGSVGVVPEDARLRFEREALVASRLEHPGICPVYEAGMIDGAPYIAMRYLEGETLARRIATAGDAADAHSTWIEDAEEDRAAGEPAPSPTAQGPTTRAELMGTVRLFERIARALHAAHEAGVIHRDIKPGNIMVTGEGEPVILDFGLARLDEGDLPTLTRTGDTFGTPAYMSPEQLARDPVRLDRGTDVWSLGVTLYQCLLLKRPFEAPTREQLYLTILTREPPDPRRHSSAIPRDLAVILGAALEKDRERRYLSAGALADDLAAFLEGRPIAARRVGPVGRFVRWARREPAKMALLLVLLIALPTIAALVTKYLNALPKAEAQRLAERALERDEHLAEGYYALGEGDPDEAMRQFETASSIEADAPEAVMAIALAHLRAGRPRETLALLDRHPDPSGRGAGFLIRADAHRALQEPDRAADTEKSAPPPQDPLDYYLLGRWLFSRGEHAAASSALTRAILLSGTPRALFYQQRAIAAAFSGDQSGVGDTAAALAQLWPGSPASWFFSGVAFEHDGSLEEARSAYSQALRLKPDYVWAHNNLGNVLRQLGEHEAAIAAHREAIRLKPDHAKAHNNLGIDLSKEGRLDEAVNSYRHAIRLRPGYAIAHYNLGNALRDQGLVEEAIHAYREAIRFQPNYAKALANLGSLLSDQGQLDEAIAELFEATRLDPESAFAHHGLGNALAAQGRHEEAIASYRAALRTRTDDANIHYNLGNSLLEKKLDDEAIAAYRDALIHRPDFANARYHLGLALARQDRIDEAIAANRAAIAHQPDHAGAHYSLGLALARRGEIEEGLEAYRAAVRLEKDDARDHRRMARILHGQGATDEAIEVWRAAIRAGPDHAESHFALGCLLQGCGEVPEAIACYREAIRLMPDYPEAHGNLGVCFQRIGRHDEAITCHSEAIRLQPDLPEAHINLGSCFGRKGQHDQAIACFREAIRLNPELARAHSNLGSSLRATGRGVEAIDPLREAIRLDPRYATPHYILGNVFRKQRRHEEAIVSFREAIRLNPRYAPARYSLGLMLSYVASYEDAIPAYREAVRLRPSYAHAWYKLGSALYREARFREALKALRRGHELGSQQAKWDYPSERSVAACVPLAEAQQRLKDPLELISLAAKELREERFVTAACWYRIALRKKPDLVEDPRNGHRFEAARVALAVGLAPDPSVGQYSNEGAVWRRRALDWLRADLDSWNALLDAGALQKPANCETLERWRQDAFLIRARKEPFLRSLPSEERKAWEELWSRLDDLLAKL